MWHLSLYVLFLIYPGMSSTVLRHYVCKQVRSVQSANRSAPSMQAVVGCARCSLLFL